MNGESIERLWRAWRWPLAIIFCAGAAALVLPIITVIFLKGQ